MTNSRPDPDRTNLQDCCCGQHTNLAERQFAERIGGTGAGQARPAELDHRHRLYRFRLCRLSAHPRTQDGESAIQEPGRSRHGSGGRSDPGLHARLRDRAPASGGWNCESTCGHQSRTRPGNSQRSDCSRGWLPVAATGQIVSPGNATEFAASIAQQREQVAAVAKLFGNKPVQ